jgi:hypothetical protein
MFLEASATESTVSSKHRHIQNERLVGIVEVFLGALHGHMAMAGLARRTNDVMPHEQRQFLGSCYSLWTTGSNSPVELTSRIETACSRSSCRAPWPSALQDPLHDPDWEAPVVFNHHQGHRGNHLVPLGNAANLARGFADPQSRQVLQQHFGVADLQRLQVHLYPIASHTVAVDRVASIRQEDELELDPPYTFAPCSWQAGKYRDCR